MTVKSKLGPALETPIWSYYPNIYPFMKEPWSGDHLSGLKSWKIVLDQKLWRFEICRLGQVVKGKMEQVKIGSTSPDRINTSNDLKICLMTLILHTLIIENYFFKKETLIFIYGLNSDCRVKIGSSSRDPHMIPLSKYLSISKKGMIRR